MEAFASNATTPDALDAAAKAPTAVDVVGAIADGAVTVMDPEAEEEALAKRRKKNLSNAERKAMAEFLLQRCQGAGRLPHSALADAAARFQVHRNTASRIWQLMKPTLAATEARTARLPAKLDDELARQVLSRKRNSGRKKKDYSAEMERLKQLPMHQRGSLRALASAVGVPRTTLFRLLRDEDDGATSRTTVNTVKPVLSDKNKLERLRFCAAKLRPNGLFDDMFNAVHLNMKLFALCGTGGHVEGGKSPAAVPKKKTRVMFMAAVARPQWDIARNEQFDGKLGIWPFLSTTLAGEPSLEQPAVVESVTKTEIQQLLATQILPAIKQKLPRHLQTSGPVFVQLDSQHLRLPADDPVVPEQGSTDGWTMRLQYQPPYSPDLVVLDHGFFKFIEAAVKDRRPETVEQLVDAVDRAFAEMPKRHVNDAFLALQKAMEATMLVRGSNCFELEGNPGKRSLQLDGSLPVSVLCKPEAVLACRSALETADQ